MFKKPALPLVTAAAGFLLACSPIPGTGQVAPATPADFVQASPTPTPGPSSSPADPDPLDNDTAKDVETPTLFQPQLTFSLDSLKAGDTPGVSTRIYQVRGELEILQTDTFIEHASFHFEKLSVGQLVGGGTMELGTPPKATLNVAVVVTSTDNKQSALMSVKASGDFANVYISDLYVQQTSAGLMISSLGNATRADAQNGNYTTIRSGAVTQTFQPGLLQLPASPGPMRTRTIITGDKDPTTQVAAVKVYRQTFTIQ